MMKKYPETMPGKKNGCRTNIEDDLQDRFSSSTTDENIERARADRRITIDAIASKLRISYESIRSILRNDLNMHRFCLQKVSTMLSCEQKEVRVNGQWHGS
ncbi:hypothetical protein TNCV_3771581 [Trichonephila clavipes]|nr:hypothetical protein TNCV_3771581 [Trichonephila clavipes]